MLKWYKKYTFAKNIAEVIFLNKDKHKYIRREADGNTKEIIDLTAYIKSDMVEYDTNGSYTGITYDTYYNGELEKPIQDADDL